RSAGSSCATQTRTTDAAHSSPLLRQERRSSSKRFPITSRQSEHFSATSARRIKPCSPTCSEKSLQLRPSFHRLALEQRARAQNVSESRGRPGMAGCRLTTKNPRSVERGFSVL